jgi:polyhydroxyalkanoate synthesis regulator phasin
MAGEDLFKRYLEIGASVLGMSRERAERIVADLVASGEVAKGQAAKAADWLVERGRTGSEEFTELVRREIRQQIAALGLATKDDIARLQAQIDELRTPPQPAAEAPGPGRQCGNRGDEAGRRHQVRPPQASRRPPLLRARRRPARRRSGSREGLTSCAGGSTPSWCAGDWSPAGIGHRPRSSPGG